MTELMDRAGEPLHFISRLIEPDDLFTVHNGKEAEQCFGLKEILQLDVAGINDLKWIASRVSFKSHDLHSGYETPYIPPKYPR